MPNPLTPEQLEALKAVPLGEMPNRLRIALALAQLKQSDVAEQTGIAREHLSKLVTGSYGTVTIDTARKLADYFGTSIEDLFPARELEEHAK